MLLQITGEVSAQAAVAIATQVLEATWQIDDYLRLQQPPDIAPERSMSGGRS